MNSHAYEISSRLYPSCDVPANTSPPLPSYFPGLIRRMEAVMRTQPAHRWRTRQSSYCNVSAVDRTRGWKMTKSSLRVERCDVQRGWESWEGVQREGGTRKRGGLWVLLIAHRHCCRPRGSQKGWEIMRYYRAESGDKLIPKPRLL